MPKPSIRGRYGMMKLSSCIVLLIVALFYSCQKDSLMNCNCTLPAKDMLCKTYLFNNEVCIGYIEYAYNAQLQKETETYKSVKGKIEKTISYTYNNAGFISEMIIETRSPEKKERISYVYNLTNKIENIEIFDDETLIKSKLYAYNNSNELQQTKIISGGVLDTLISFEYDVEGKLWRESFYNSDSLLSSYQIHQFYFNGIERVNFYNANDVYSGYNLWVHDSDGNIISFSDYDQTNNLIEKTIYTYENRLLKKVSTQDGFGHEISYIAYFYS